jgi:hypothetical protein
LTGVAPSAARSKIGAPDSDRNLGWRIWDDIFSFQRIIIIIVPTEVSPLSGSRQIDCRRRRQHFRESEKSKRELQRLLNTAAKLYRVFSISGLLAGFENQVDSDITTCLNHHSIHRNTVPDHVVFESNSLSLLPQWEVLNSK